MVTRHGGFSLVELLVALTLMGVVMGLTTSILTVSMSAWHGGEAEMALATAGDEAMNGIVSGLEYVRGLNTGIEDYLMVLVAEPRRLEGVPLWRVENGIRDGEALPLPVRKQPGSLPPIAFRGDGKTPIKASTNLDGTEIQFEKQNQEWFRAIAYYHPDIEVQDAQLRLYLDREKGRVIHEYRGKRRQLPLATRGTRVTDLRFEYYMLSDPTIAREQLDRPGDVVKGVAVTLTLEKADIKRTFRKLVLLRNAGRAMVLTPRTRVAALLPPSDTIRLLELQNLSPGSPGDRIRLRAGAWSVEITYITSDTATVRQSIAGVAELETLISTRFGISLLNPDILIDADGIATPGAGTIEHGGRLRPGDKLALLQTNALRYLDRNRNASYDPNETVFFDANNNARFDGEDRQIFFAAPDATNVPARSLLQSDSKILQFDEENSGQYDLGEALILDGNQDGKWGGPFYDCANIRQSIPLDVEQFEIDGATLIVR